MIPGPELERLLARKPLLIFDFDGTIADSSPLHEQAFREVLEPLGLRVNYSRLAGRTTTDAVRICFKQNQRAVPPDETVGGLALQKQDRGRALISARLTAFPAAAALLDWSRSRHRLSLVTSGSRATIDLGLARLGLAGWFDPILTAEDMERAKPDPQGFLEATRTAGFTPEQALVFEDSEAGFEAARRAGIDVVDAARLESMMVKGADNGD